VPRKPTLAVVSRARHHLGLEIGVSRQVDLLATLLRLDQLLLDLKALNFPQHVAWNATANGPVVLGLPHIADQLCGEEEAQGLLDLGAPPHQQLDGRGEAFLESNDFVQARGQGLEKETSVGIGGDFFEGEGPQVIGVDFGGSHRLLARQNLAVEARFDTGFLSAQTPDDDEQKRDHRETAGFGGRHR
jgi:hypothetical protein